MNSQNIIFKINLTEDEFARSLGRTKTPFIIVETPHGKIFSHLKFGTFELNDKEGLLKLTATFLPCPSLDDYVQLGRMSRLFSELGFEYELFLDKIENKELLFSHVQQKFRSK